MVTAILNSLGCVGKLLIMPFRICFRLVNGVSFCPVRLEME